MFSVTFNYSAVVFCCFKTNSFLKLKCFQTFSGDSRLLSCFFLLFRNEILHIRYLSLLMFSVICNYSAVFFAISKRNFTHKVSLFTHVFGDLQLLSCFFLLFRNEILHIRYLSLLMFSVICNYSAVFFCYFETKFYT